MKHVIESLLQRHRNIEGRIRRERRRLLPDSLRLQRLKKLKLAVKDRLFRYSRDGGA